MRIGWAVTTRWLAVRVVIAMRSVAPTGGWARPTNQLNLARPTNRAGGSKCAPPDGPRQTARRHQSSLARAASLLAPANQPNVRDGSTCAPVPRTHAHQRSPADGHGQRRRESAPLGVSASRHVGDDSDSSESAGAAKFQRRDQIGLGASTELPVRGRLTGTRGAEAGCSYRAPEPAGVRRVWGH